MGFELRKSKIAKNNTKQAKNPTTFAKKTMASCLRFSTSKYSGSDKNKYPITAADNTNRLNMVIGIIMVSFSPSKIELATFTTRTITII